MKLKHPSINKAPGFSGYDMFLLSIFSPHHQSGTWRQQVSPQWKFQGFDLASHRANLSCSDMQAGPGLAKLTWQMLENDHLQWETHCKLNGQFSS